MACSRVESIGVDAVFTMLVGFAKQFEAQGSQLCDGFVVLASRSDAYIS